MHVHSIIENPFKNQSSEKHIPSKQITREFGINAAKWKTVQVHTHSKRQSVHLITSTGPSVCGICL